jgi:hypothetical protein
MKEAMIFNPLLDIYRTMVYLIKEEASAYMYLIQNPEKLKAILKQKVLSLSFPIPIYALMNKECLSTGSKITKPH